VFFYFWVLGSFLLLDSVIFVFDVLTPQIYKTVLRHNNAFCAILLMCIL